MRSRRNTFLMKLTLPLAALTLLLAAPAWSMSVSPSPSFDGSYTVSWTTPWDCRWYPSYVCYSFEERVNGGDWTPVSGGYGTGSTSWNASGKSPGTYEYRMMKTSSGTGYYPVLNDGPVSVTVCGAPAFSISDASISEGGTLTFTVTSSGSACAYSVSYYTADNSASSGGDYTYTANTLTFTPGQTTLPVYVSTANDVYFENSETMFVYLYGATGGATIPDNQGIGTIGSDDPAPSFTIGADSKTEGTNLQFAVTLNGYTQYAHAVSYSTASNTAAYPGDFPYQSSTLSSFTSNQTKYITVPANSDGLFENVENFTVTLYSPTNGAQIGTAQATGSITSTDPAPTFSVSGASAAEGSSLQLAVTLNGASQYSHDVSFWSGNGSATAPSDYNAVSGTLTGLTSNTTQYVTIPIVDDALFENAETLLLSIGSPTGGAQIGTAQATGTISSDDPAPTFSVSSVSAAEGGTLQFSITLNGASQYAHGVSYQTTNNTATGPDDYTPKSGSLSGFTSNTTQNVTVGTVTDLYFEGDETLLLALASPTNGATTGGSGVGTIIDDDDDEPSGAFALAPGGSDAPGITVAELTVDQLGNARYDIPIAVPPGTAGMQPDISLSYSSGGGNSFLGVGWSVNGLSAISRCPKTIAQDSAIDGVDYDADDRFCLDGQRLIAVSGAYGANGTEYRTEVDQFARIVSYGTAGSGPQHFKVWTKPGRILEYGNTADSRIEAEGRSEIRVWAVNKIGDTVGNYMKVSYWEESNHTDFQPELIEYTFNDGAGLTGYASVDFVYEPRPDVQPSGLYEGGSAITNTTNRLTNIRTFDRSTLVRDYQLGYDQNGLNSASRLISVTECAAAGACLPPITFGWWGDGTAPDLTSASLSLPGVPAGTTSDYSPVFGDWNGDGRSDLFLQAEHDGTSMLYVANESGQQIATSFAMTDWSQEEDPEDRRQVFTGDFNADGRSDLAVLFLDYTGQQCFPAPPAPDICLKYYNASVNVYHAQVSGSATTMSLASSYAIGSVASQADVKTGDWNGDGRTDLSINADLHFADSSGAIGAATYASITVIGGEAYLGDFDGDGRTDVLAESWPSTAYWEVHLATGSGFVATGPSALKQGEPRIADFNGDGLDDLFEYSSTGSDYLYLSQGDGTFVQVSELGVGAASEISIGDWNSDGRADIAYPSGSSMQFFVSTGAASGFFSPLTSISGWSQALVFPGDFNGDGVTDLWRREASSDTVYVSSHGGFDLIDTVTTGIAGHETVSEIEYAPMTDTDVYTPGAAASYPAATVQNSRYVVATVSVEDGVGGERSTTYSYEHGVSDLLRRAGYGFGKITATDERTSIATTTTYRQDFPFTGMALSETKHYAGILLESTDYEYPANDGVDPPVTTHTGVYFPHARSTVRRLYELDESQTGSLLVSITKESTPDVNYDAFGNLESATTAIFSSETSFAANDPDFTTDTDRAYKNDTSGWLIGQLICQTVQSSDGIASATRTVGFEYASNGLVTKEVIEPTEASLTEPSGFSQCETLYGEEPDYGADNITLVTTFAHDSFGNRTGITVDDIVPATPARTTGIEYGELDSGTNVTPNGRFPVKITNAKGHVEYRQYDPRFGALVRARDANNVETEWDLDGFGRPIAEYRTNATQTETHQANIYRGWCSTQTCPGGGMLKVVTIPDGAPATAVITDILGREVAIAQAGFDGTAILRRTVYDNKGQISARSRPYFYGDTEYWHTYEYEALGRVKKEVSPGESGPTETNIVYLPREVRTTNANNQHTRQYFNVRGELVEVVNAFGTAEETSTTYEYDVFGNLEAVEVDGNSATRIENTYDILGRKLSTDDPDMGAWSYGYSAFGELTQQTDAKGQTAYFEYDVLGRLHSRTEAEGTTDWTWDTAANGKGQLASVASPEGEAKSFGYDAFARTSSVTTSITGEPTSFVTGFGYDLVGRLETITYPASTAYPSGLRVRYDYNVHGHLAEVRNDDTSNALFWRMDEQTADGQWAEITFGNGVTTEYGYVPQTGRIATIQSSSPTGTNDVQNLEYDFDALGNLSLRKDVRQDVREEFTSYAGVPAYDALNRLRNVQRYAGTTLQEVETFSYDPLGNLTVRTENTDTALYDYANNWVGCAHGSGPHAVKNILGAIQFCYDQNGNQLSLVSPVPDFPSRTITWTSYNKPRAVTLASTGDSLTFYYGAGRERFKQVNEFTDQTTIYVDGLYEQHSAGSADTHVHYIFAGSQAVAIYKSRSDSTDETLYLHRDHLGSVSDITDESAVVVERLSYDALGKRRDPDWSDSSSVLVYGEETARGFTGHEHLDDVALIHMGGRVYDPLIGRMLSPDPYVQFPAHSQSYNRYSYVLNNPLAFTDPSGFCIAAGPNCPSGLAGGLSGGPVIPAKSGVSFHLVPVIRRSFSLGFSFGSYLGGWGGSCPVVTGLCNRRQTIEDMRGLGNAPFILSISGSVYLSFQSVLVLGANTEAPDQSDGSVTRFLLGKHFGKYAAAAGPLLAEAGNPGARPLRDLGPTSPAVAPFDPLSRPGREVIPADYTGYVPEEIREMIVDVIPELGEALAVARIETAPRERLDEIAEALNTDTSNISAYADGTTIYVPPGRGIGIGTLTHEITHVWQHLTVPNFGREYEKATEDAYRRGATTPGDAYTFNRFEMQARRNARRIIEVYP